MSVCHNLRLCSPLKTVLGRLGDTYQAYCNTYKTHAMATHHRGSGKPLDREVNMTRNNTNFDIPQDFHHEDTDDFENVEHKNPTKLAAYTRELADLCQKIQAEETQHTVSLHHIEWELQQLSILLNASAPPEPLEEVLNHYMDAICSTQK